MRCVPATAIARNKVKSTTCTGGECLSAQADGRARGEFTAHADKTRVYEWCTRPTSTRLVVVSSDGQRGTSGELTAEERMNAAG
jgi:hypothetical protein